MNLKFRTEEGGGLALAMESWVGLLRNYKKMTDFDVMLYMQGG